MGAVRIRHSIREFATQPVILWILLGGKPKWLPLNFGFNDVMRTDLIVPVLIHHASHEIATQASVFVHSWVGSQSGFH